MSLKPSRVIRGTLFLTALLIVVVGLTSGHSARAFQRTINPPTITLVSPQPGDVLHPGDTVTVVWELSPNGEHAYAGCEQEVYLSLDKGKTVAARLTPEMSPLSSSFQWTVPNLPTKKAILNIHFGCETGPNVFETSNPQKHSVFRILPAADGFQEVKVSSAQRSDTPSGSEINLTWESSVVGVESYHVMASFDKGAHFSSIGQTTGQAFTWNLDGDFSGAITFKVVARRSDGTTVESITNPNPMIVGRGL